jgi:hypothetical protein
MKISDVLGMGSDGARDKFFDKMKEMLNACWDYCICTGKFKDGPNFLQKEDGSSRWSPNNLKIAADTALTGLKNFATTPPIDLNTYIMDFPFMLYYRL